MPETFADIIDTYRTWNHWVQGKSRQPVNPEHVTAIENAIAWNNDNLRGTIDPADVVRDLEEAGWTLNRTDGQD